MKQIIKYSVLVTALALAWSLETQTAAADSVRSTRSVRLMSRPGEKSRVVKRVPSGRTMKVLQRKGRWVKVRVGSQAGWVTRTSVREAGESRQARSKSVRKTRRAAFVEGRSKRRGWSDGAPEDRIGADTLEEKQPRRKSRRVSKRSSDDFDDFEEEDYDEDIDMDEDEDDVAEDMVVVTADEAEVYAKPSTRSDAQFIAEEGDKLYMVGKSESGKWIEVENDEGEYGWVKASDVEDNSPYEYKRMGYHANGGLGYTALGMAFTSDGVGQLANYNMSSAAASLVVNGEVLYAGGSDTRLLGVDLQYRGTRATPGIRYDDGAGNIADIAFTMHEIDVGASYGYRFKRSDGLAAFARAGYHYGQFQVKGVNDIETANIARLPSELLKGFTVGGKLIAPRLTKTIGASLDVEYLLSGSRTQTVGLEDGATSRVSGLWGVAAMNYQWKPDMQIVAAYRYFTSTTEWAGMAPDSQRTHNATLANRKDVVHTLSVGVGKQF
jgi:uncharacterized protein YgiM (DUF1202 family)